MTRHRCPAVWGVKASARTASCPAAAPVLPRSMRKSGRDGSRDPADAHTEDAGLVQERPGPRMTGVVKCYTGQCYSGSGLITLDDQSGDLVVSRAGRPLGGPLCAGDAVEFSVSEARVDVWHDATYGCVVVYTHDGAVQYAGDLYEPLGCEYDVLKVYDARDVLRRFGGGPEHAGWVPGRLKARILADAGLRVAAVAERSEIPRRKAVDVVALHVQQHYAWYVAFCGLRRWRAVGWLSGWGLGWRAVVGACGSWCREVLEWPYTAGGGGVPPRTPPPPPKVTIVGNQSLTPLNAFLEFCRKNFGNFSKTFWNFFGKIFKKISIKFPKNFHKFSAKFPKNFQKISTNFPKNIKKFQKISENISKI